MSVVAQVQLNVFGQTTLHLITSQWHCGSQLKRKKSVRSAKSAETTATVRGTGKKRIQTGKYDMRLRV